MNTDALIRSLAGDLKPVARHAIARQIGIGLCAGGIGSVLMVGWWLGFRSDFDIAIRDYSFWIKWLYTGALAACAIVATIQLARPEPVRMHWLWVLALPVALLATIGVVEMMAVPSNEWLEMWLGRSWKQCPSIVMSLSVPIFIGLFWAYRRLAPTRLRLAGAVAGLTAGSLAATLYCLHCPETSAIFVLTWYTAGIASVAAIGALLGPRLLRW